MDADDDTALIDALRQGDPQAPDVFVRANAGWMLTVANRLLGDTSLAQDCVQEGFLSAFKALHTFERRSSLKTWLHRIVINAALMKLRAQRRANEHAIDDLLPDFDSNDCRLEAPWHVIEQPDALLEKSETAEIIRQKIAELPENYRIVLLLRDIEELSTQDVADMLQVTEGTVKVRLHRARAALKRLLEPVLRGER